MSSISKAASFLRGLRIREVSTVDRGAGEGVQIMLSKRDLPADVDAYMKREFSDDKRKELAASGAAMPGGGYPIENVADLKNAVDAFGRAKDKAATKKHIIARAKALNAESALPDEWKVSKADFLAAVAPAVKKAMPKLSDDASDGFTAFLAKNVGHGDPVIVPAFDDLAKAAGAEFQGEFGAAADVLTKSISSILLDAAITTKADAIEKSITQFADHLAGAMPEELQKALAAGFAASQTDKGDTMSDAVKKALGLPATATDAEVEKAIVTLASGEIATLKAANAKLEAFAKMSDKHKAFMDKGKMPSGGKDAFQSMSPEERDSHMAKNPVEDDEAEAKKRGDAFAMPDGTLITKSAVGAGVFAVLKSQNDRIVAQEVALAKAADERESELAKRESVELGFQPEFGEVMRKAFKGGDAESVKKMKTEITALRAQAETGTLFRTFGKSGSAPAGSARAEFDAKAADLHKADPKTYKTVEAAFSKVYSDPANAELKKRYKAEGAAN